MNKRWIGLVMLLLALAGCGGEAPTATTIVPPTRDPASTAEAFPDAGDPVAVVQEFMTALFTGGDSAGFVCAASPEIAAMFRAAGAMAVMSGSTLDVHLEGLRYTLNYNTGDAASVTVNGEVVYGSGEFSDRQPYDDTEITLVNEAGTWKVCGSAG